MNDFYIFIIIILILTFIKNYIPNGKIKPISTWAISLVLALYILFPVKNIIEKVINLDFNSSSIAIQDDFINAVKVKQISIDKDVIISALENQNIKVKSIDFEYEYDSTIIYKKVTIILDNRGITDENSHINIEKIEEIVKSIIKREVEVYIT